MEPLLWVWVWDNGDMRWKDKLDVISARPRPHIIRFSVFGFRYPSVHCRSLPHRHVVLPRRRLAQRRAPL